MNEFTCSALSDISELAKTAEHCPSVCVSLVTQNPGAYAEELRQEILVQATSRIRKERSGENKRSKAGIGQATQPLAVAVSC